MDMKLPLACVLIAGGALGLAMPGFQGEEQAERVQEVPQATAETTVSLPDARLATVQGPSVWAEEIVLQRESDGHFYADVQVGGRNFRMLVDTGATVVALTAQDAMAMGLYWDDAAVAPVARGANGPVEGVNTSIDRMAIGGMQATDVRAIIIPEGAGISLLGQSFLSTIGRVEISGDRMVLGT